MQSEAKGQAILGLSKINFEKVIKLEIFIWRRCSILSIKTQLVEAFEFHSMYAIALQNFADAYFIKTIV